jgi:histidyl-tRNA synthetase
MCMLAADTLEALGIPRGSYVIKVSNRKILDGVLEAVGLGDDEHAARRLVVLRAIDKLDRLGIDGVRELLGPGRKDDSGDFTNGANLNAEQIGIISGYLSAPAPQPKGTGVMTRSPAGEHKAPLAKQPSYVAGTEELNRIRDILSAAQYDEDRIRIDQTVVRGLEYYTGPVFEAELTFPATDESGQTVRFGSVGGGGRYDGLVSRFRSQPVPATGFSIGVSRLYAALSHLGKIPQEAIGLAPVVVLVMDKSRVGDYQKMARDLRDAGVRAEMYVGNAGMKAQMKYADRRGSPCVIIQGEDERAKGEVTIKDLLEGARLSAGIEDRAGWVEARPAQFSVPETEMVAAVRKLLAGQRRS